MNTLRKFSKILLISLSKSYLSGSGTIILDLTWEKNFGFNPIHIHNTGYGCAVVSADRIWINK
jgi:hypothetical protein